MKSSFIAAGCCLFCCLANCQVKNKTVLVIKAHYILPSKYIAHCVISAYCLMIVYVISVYCLIIVCACIALLDAFYCCCFVDWLWRAACSSSSLMGFCDWKVCIHKFSHLPTALL